MYNFHNVPADGMFRAVAASRARHFMLTRPLAPKDLAPATARPGQSKAELLPFNTPPWQFPRDALGLSLYFITKGSIVVLLVVLTVISMIPLSENLSAKNFSATFRLFERRLTPSSAWGADAEWADTEVTECRQTTGGVRHSHSPLHPPATAPGSLQPQALRTATGHSAHTSTRAQPERLPAQAH